MPGNKEGAAKILEKSKQKRILGYASMVSMSFVPPFQRKNVQCTPVLKSVAQDYVYVNILMCLEKCLLIIVWNIIFIQSGLAQICYGIFRIPLLYHKFSSHAMQCTYLKEEVNQVWIFF